MTVYNTFNTHREALLNAHIKHPFIQQLLNGSLPKSGFDNYIIQDYKYLLTYVRGFYRLASIAPTLAHIDFARNQANTCLDEELLGNHVQQFMNCNIDMPTIDNTHTHPDAKIYIQHIENIMERNNYAQLLYVLSSCFIGYVDMAEHIINNNMIDDKNPYYRWVKLYTSDIMVRGRNAYLCMLQDAEDYLSDSDVKIINTTMDTTLSLEVGFWNTGL